MECITLRSLVVPSLRLGATAQGIQVINYVDPCVLKSNYYVASVMHNYGIIYQSEPNRTRLRCLTYIDILEIILANQ